MRSRYSLQFDDRELAAGEHQLSVEIVGAHPRAVKAYMFGLDYVRLLRRYSVRRSAQWACRHSAAASANTGKNRKQRRRKLLHRESGRMHAL